MCIKRAFLPVSLILKMDGERLCVLLDVRKNNTYLCVFLKNPTLPGAEGGLRSSPPPPFYPRGLGSTPTMPSTGRLDK